MYYIYIISNQEHSAFFVGLTNKLPKRIAMHEKMASLQSLGGHFHLNKLVYLQAFTHLHEAILCEQNLKTLPENDLPLVIENNNPSWDSLNEMVYRLGAYGQYAVDFPQAS